MVESFERDYLDWLNEVDVEMDRMVGLSRADIADYDWADEYEWGSTPYEAARNALEESGLGLYLYIEKERLY